MPDDIVEENVVVKVVTFTIPHPVVYLVSHLACLIPPHHTILASFSVLKEVYQEKLGHFTVRAVEGI